MSIKVLAVDDEWPHVQLLKVILSTEGFEAVVENDSSSALDRAKSVSPDVILLDVNMPEPSGYEVFKQLRSDEQTKNIPVVMVTARAQIEDIERGNAMGVDGYVTKPFDPVELVATIRKVVGIGGG